MSRADREKTKDTRKIINNKFITSKIYYLFVEIFN